jgi:hypothetical protein
MTRRPVPFAHAGPIDSSKRRDPLGRRQSANQRPIRLWHFPLVNLTGPYLARQRQIFRKGKLDEYTYSAS